MKEMHDVTVKFRVPAVNKNAARDAVINFLEAAVDRFENSRDWQHFWAAYASGLAGEHDVDPAEFDEVPGDWADGWCWGEE